MRKIKVGVIGTGHLGRLHTSLYKEIVTAELTGIYDSDAERLKNVSDELNVKQYNNVEELLDAVEAVNIVTPTTTHFNIAKKALEFDCHIFIEKPITTTISEAEDLLQLARNKNRYIQVGHIERFNPALLSLSDVKLEPKFIEAHRLASFNPRGTDVAVILDLMIHDLDLILSLVKSDPAQIDASGVKVISDAIDIANARIQFENGCVANITASRISTKKMRKMRLFQKNAYISLDFSEGFSEIYYISEDEKLNFEDGTLAFSLGNISLNNTKKEIKYNKLQKSGINPLKFELESFLDSVGNNFKPLVSGEDGLKALKLASNVMNKIEEYERVNREILT